MFGLLAIADLKVHKHCSRNSSQFFRQKVLRTNVRNVGQLEHLQHIVKFKKN